MAVAVAVTAQQKASKHVDSSELHLTSLLLPLPLLPHFVASTGTDCSRLPSRGQQEIGYGSHGSTKVVQQPKVYNHSPMAVLSLLPAVQQQQQQQQFCRQFVLRLL